MLKKIIAAVLLMGFIGVLVWGGINRTLAKNNDRESRNTNPQNIEHVEYAEGNGVQGRGNGNQGQGNLAQNENDIDNLSEGLAQQSDSLSQAESDTNGFQVDLVTENHAAPAESLVQSQNQGNGNRSGQGNGNGQGRGVDPLSANEIEALNLALDDEYHALAVYQAVIATFGEVEPFTQIAASEQRHIDALINQFNKNGLTIPANPWIGNVPTFESLQQACQAGAEAEIANAELYDQLFNMTDNPSLTRVFTNLSNASLNSHLPDFQACE